MGLDEIFRLAAIALSLARLVRFARWLEES